MKRTIFTISREFASGGRLVGQMLAKELDIPFYDRELIEMAAERSGLSPEFIEKAEENASSSFLYSLATTHAHPANGYFLHYDMPIGDKAFLAQAAVIREIAQKGSCVILGRCAGYILRDDPACINMFLHSSLEDRLNRAVEVYGMERKGLADKLVKIDRGRANYHRYYTGEQWRDMHAYDIVINTGVSGIEGAVRAILAVAEAREKKL